MIDFIKKNEAHWRFIGEVRPFGRSSSPTSFHATVGDDDVVVVLVPFGSWI